MKFFRFLKHEAPTCFFIFLDSIFSNAHPYPQLARSVAPSPEFSPYICLSCGGPLELKRKTFKKFGWTMIFLRSPFIKLYILGFSFRPCFALAILPVVSKSYAPCELSQTLCSGRIFSSSFCELSIQ